MSILLLHRTLKGLFRLITGYNNNESGTWYMSTRWFLLLTSIALLFTGCKDAERPAGVLSHQEMVNVLAEVYILEEKVKPLNLKPDSTDQLVRQMKERLLDSLHVPDSVFRVSLDYYWDNPKEMEAIYDALVDSLNLREQGFTIPEKQ